MSLWFAALASGKKVSKRRGRLWWIWENWTSVWLFSESGWVCTTSTTAYGFQKHSYWSAYADIEWENRAECPSGKHPHNNFWHVRRAGQSICQDVCESGSEPAAGTITSAILLSWYPLLHLPYAAGGWMHRQETLLPGVDFRDSDHLCFPVKFSDVGHCKRAWRTLKVYYAQFSVKTT